MSIIDRSTGTVLTTWTRSDPSDVIGTTVGGNRYGWFPVQAFSALPIDNVAQSADTVYVDSAWSGSYGTDPDGAGPAHGIGIDAFSTLQAAIDAVNAGGVVNVAAGSYAGATVDKDITLNGGAGVIVNGASPALTVMNGDVIVQNGMTFNQTTAAPTILVESGGSLTLQASTVNESSTSNQAAIQVQSGGALDLSSDDNTLNVIGAGQLLDWQDSTPLEIIGNTLQQDGGAFADNFAIEDAITHALDNASYGLVTWVANNVYVTTNSGSIQRGIDAASGGDTVNVDAGSFAENLILAKQINLLGRRPAATRGRAGDFNASVSSIISPSSGDGLELQAGSAGSVIDGFTFDGGARGIESMSGPLDALELRNSHFENQTINAVFLNDNGENLTINQNVFVGSAASSTVFHLDTDDFDGLYFTNNDVLRTGNPHTGIGLFVDGNHNVGPSGLRTPLIQGNVFEGHGNGANLGLRHSMAATYSTTSSTTTTALWALGFKTATSREMSFQIA